jgi:hypothetical protein
MECSTLYSSAFKILESVPLPFPSYNKSPNIISYYFNCLLYLKKKL